MGILVTLLNNQIEFSFMQATFFQKFFLAMIAGFFAACLLYGYRHIVQEAFYESNEGWKTSLYGTPAPHR